ncbi:leucine-rich repeats and immunoglobulin-like domains protein 3 [Oppia nitens]|uniref:leucine-rich repeats and immunoglobulin-like domains protein 3 n=1 Tax=Oppia nitens TaxID=1686743 RepID=UPI0023D9C384|nr:leucine-rich repeats and immunoglobulin-like domains protein 3 [Oppia nitens]
MIRHQQQLLVILVLTILTIGCRPAVLLLLTNTDPDVCPKQCSCLGALVDCSKRRLSSVPQPIPKWCELLELSYNPLNTVDNRAFGGLRHLFRLDLSHTQLKQLDTNLFINGGTTAAAANEVDASDLQTAILDLKLNNNLFQKFPQLNGLYQLKQLVIHHNSIDTLANSSVDLYPSLETIDLSHNLLTTIPNEFFSNRSHRLTSVNFNNNRLTSIEKFSFDHLIHLEVLKLSKNKLSSLPKELFRRLTALKELDLSRNRLQSLEGLVFHGLDSLETLRLRKNQLTHLFDGTFWGLNKIQYLYLDHNNLTSIRKGWLYGLSSLKQLFLNNNEIEDIDGDGWEFSNKLMELDLSYNRIHSIAKEMFSRLHSLQYLTLNYNSISFIDDSAFRSLSALETLGLNHNQISWTIEDSSGSFIGLEKLRNLGLAFNFIKSITKRTFSGLTNLEIVDLSHNPIASIQDQSFQWFQNLQEMRLNTTDLVCDCTLKWLPIWLANSQIAKQHRMTATEAKCKHPERLINQSLIDANSDEFICQDYLKPYLIDDFKHMGDKPLKALKGDNMTLTCRAASSSPQPIEFQWRKDNQILNTSMDSNNNNINNNVFLQTFAKQRDGGAGSSGNITEYTGNLLLTDIEDQDEGRYQCIASNNFGTVYTHKIRINVHVWPTFTKTPNNVTVKVGNTARLECAARGQPMPEISWQKDGGDNFPAAMERRMHVMPADDVFFIVEVKVQDMGLYTCTATNDAGSHTASAYLNVLEMPTFVRPMTDKEAIIGETAVIECMASGSPKPVLQWTKDGGAIIATERHFFTADNQLLIIVKTQESDEGEYSCEMSNILGSTKETIFLDIIPGGLANVAANDNIGGKMDDTFTLNTFIIENSRLIGIIVIAVFTCIAMTSLIWVIIIYRTRKRHNNRQYLDTNCSSDDDDEAVDDDDANDTIRRLSAKHRNKELMTSNVFLQITTTTTTTEDEDETTSLNSDSSAKDSGTGDSARQHQSQEAIDETTTATTMVTDDYKFDMRATAAVAVGSLSPLHAFNTSYRCPTKAAAAATTALLHKGLSMDQISAKRKAKLRTDPPPSSLNTTTIIATSGGRRHKWTDNCPTIRSSYSANDMLSVVTDV